MDFDTDIEGWPEGNWEKVLLDAARETCALVPELRNARLSVSVLFTSDDEVHALNREWRGKDKPTNVLSFPMMSRDELLALEAGGPPVMLGDLALAHGVCAREARAKGIALADHAAHLIVHGLLHLAGHDHETSAADADAMEELETAILAKLGIADPYETSNQVEHP